MLASCAIELAMSLPMAAYFHRVTALGLPVNVLVVPLIGVALPAALITFGCILISPTLAVAPAAVTAAMLHIINAIVQHAGNMRAGDLRIPAPGSGATVAAILLIAFAVWAARNSRFPVCLSMAALALTAACVLYPQPVLYHPGTLEITAIDVGQGDSLLLVSPQGRTLLIDAGGPTGGAAEASTSNFDIGEDVVSPVLWTRRIRHLDAVELTHAHSDHMGGMPAVLRNFRPKELWVGKNPGIPAYEALLEEAHSLGIQVRAFSAGDSFDFGGAHIEVLSPARDYKPGREPSNDDSLVLHVAYGHTSVLLEGDAQARSERHMLGEDLARGFAQGWPSREQNLDDSAIPGRCPSQVCNHLRRPSQPVWTPGDRGSGSLTARPCQDLSHRCPRRDDFLSRWRVGNGASAGGEVGAGRTGRRA